MPDDAQIIFRLGNLRQQLVYRYSRLTWKGYVYPDRRTVAQQNYDHTVKAELHNMIREIDRLMGEEGTGFSEPAPSNRDWPPLPRHIRERAATYGDGHTQTANELEPS